jgi:two-component system LytT family response regulator
MSAINRERSPGTELRVLIVDDEEPARKLLREYLTGIPSLVVAGECADGFQAVKAVADLDPDLLLLDIQMPKLDGFEVLELIEREIPVVFITAYDEYSIRAFDVHAVDYLLKPYARERLVEAIERARLRVGQLRSARGRTEPAPDGESRSKGGDLLPETATARAVLQARQPLERLLIRDGARIHVIPVGTIHYIEAQDDYVCVVTREQKLLKQETLNQLEAALDPGRFVRIHRSFIMNIEYLAKIEPYTKDSRVAILRSDVRLPVSRSGYERLRGLL